MRDKNEVQPFDESFDSSPDDAAAKRHRQHYQALHDGSLTASTSEPAHGQDIGAWMQEMRQRLR